MIKTECIGRAGNDSKIKELKEGKKYVSFTLAVTPFHGADTEWIDVMYKTDNEGLANFIKKGRQVYLSGRTTSVIDEYNDVKRVRTTMWASELELLGENK